jgi:transcriptional regulator with XRE-family HTH domain
MPKDDGTRDGDALRAARLALGLSQEQLARRLGVSFATVNRWERGRTRPTGSAAAGVKGVLALAAGRAKGSARRSASPPENSATDGSVLDQLAVFPATFNLEAAELVAGSVDGERSTLVVLGTLAG